LNLTRAQQPMALDLSTAPAFQAIRAKEKASFEASAQEAAEAARAEAP
jgi:hypothetical protein